MINMWWVFAVLVAIALLFVCFPMVKRRQQKIAGGERQTNISLYRDHLADIEQQLERGEIDASQFEALRLELERTLLQESQRQDAEGTVTSYRDGWLPWSLLVIVPVAAIALYQHLGASQDLEVVDLLERVAELRQSGDEAGVAEVREELLARIEKRLITDPNNFYYWVLSARLSWDEQHYPAALQAYRHALTLSPKDLTLLQEHLRAAFQVAGGVATEEISMLVDRILALSPDNMAVRGLRGRLAFSAGNYRQALSDWQKVLAALPPEHETAKVLADKVEQARAALEASGETVVSLQVQIRLAPNLEVKDGDTLFVIGRRPGMRGPPLVVKRLAGPLNFPQQVTLDDGSVMLPGASLADVEQVELIARVSRAGQPIAQPGDLEGRVGPVVVANSATTELLIDKVVQ